MADATSPTTPVRPRGIRLSRFFAVVLAGLVALVGGLFWLMLSSSRRAIEASADELRAAATLKAARQVEQHLAAADDSVTRIERRIQRGLVDLSNPGSVEAALYAEALDHPELTEITLTTGTVRGYTETDDPKTGIDAGGAILEEAGRGQIALQRIGGGGGEHLRTRRVRKEGGRFLVEVRDRPPGAPFTAGAFSPQDRPCEDPTTHPTFSTPARRNFVGRALWSDLSWAESDAALPEAERRKVVTVQKGIVDAAGRFVGVVRTALDGAALDRLGQTRVAEDQPDDPHRVFLTDLHGRLITRASLADRYAKLDDDGMPSPDGDLRVVQAGVEPALSAALASPILRGLEPGQVASGTLIVDGAPWSVSYSALPPGRTQGWVVGIAAPSAWYLRGLTAARDRTIAVAGVLLVLIFACGFLALRAVQEGLGKVVAQTDRVRGFDFAPAPGLRSTFAEMNSALASVELAKTALRAMGRYVPIELLRLLFRTHREPELGGELTDVTLLFSDIRDFTTVSEKLPPNQLATALGRYFATMTAAVHAAAGTVDKYIGDSLMVIWNAPIPCADHPQRACEAALLCVAAGRALFESPEWQGMPPWHTRFGLHRDTVTVGHFGAPDRISFTAIGDGVNLASRIEGLSKQYGTSILASETVHAAAKERYAFRRIDRVAVKGKTQGILIYELLGRRGEVDELLPMAARYERALDAYFERRFDEAAAILDENVGDEASHHLAARCRRYTREPPPPEWDGVHVSKDK